MFFCQLTDQLTAVLRVKVSKPTVNLEKLRRVRQFPSSEALLKISTRAEINRTFGKFRGKDEKVKFIFSIFIYNLLTTVPNKNIFSSF